MTLLKLIPGRRLLARNFFKRAVSHRPEIETAKETIQPNLICVKQLFSVAIGDLYWFGCGSNCLCCLHYCLGERLTFKSEMRPVPNGAA